MCSSFWMWVATFGICVEWICHPEPRGQQVPQQNCVSHEEFSFWSLLPGNFIWPLPSCWLREAVRYLAALCGTLFFTLVSTAKGGALYSALPYSIFLPNNCLGSLLFSYEHFVSSEKNRLEELPGSAKSGHTEFIPVAAPDSEALKSQQRFCFFLIISATAFIFIYNSGWPMFRSRGK